MNFGQGLPRAMVVRACRSRRSDLASYGVLTGVPAISGEQEKTRVLERFARMYAPAIGTGPVMDYLGHTGQDVLKGVDILKTAPQQYASTVQYADTLIGKICAISPRSTWPIWARSCSTRRTAASIPTSTRSLCITSCGSTSPRPSRTFSMTCGNMTLATT